jgi:hypothetical protein
MLTNKLLRCRACLLKWFPKNGTAAPCPACGSDQVSGTLELFHVGGALILVALAGWITPLFAETRAGESRAAPTAQAAIGERPTVASSQPEPEDNKAQKPPAQRALAAVVGVIQAKKLTAHVERGPARGQRVTLRRGEKVTILKREDRRFLVKDRRGNQVYVALNQVKPRPKAGTRREHVQR